MADRGEGLGALGVGATACVVCCAGPVIGFLAAAGIGTILGVALFGAVGLVVAVLALIPILRHQRATPDADPVPVEFGRRADG
jgi:hypothetical protein